MPCSRVVLPRDFKQQQFKDIPSEGDTPVSYMTVKETLCCVIF